MSVKIKKPVCNQGNKIRVDESQTDSDRSLDHPCFSFRYIHPDYSLIQCDKKEKNAFIEQLVRLSSLTWSEIRTKPKHGLGSEKIPLHSIKPNIPPHFDFTDDVEELLSFRFLSKKPFLGHLRQGILYVIFIDPKMTVYNH
jgi:hypothetical protein